MSVSSEKRSNRIRTLTECAIMVALATILSFVKLYDLPYGGSVTAASMLPILIIAYRHGLAVGLGTGFVYGAIQQLIGLNTLSYATTWQAGVAIVLLDYVVAFGVIGLGGIFRSKKRNAASSLLFGGLLVCLLRYICHVISGATVWAGISIPTKAALIYSLSYNATYMIPETIVLLIVAVYIGSVLDLDAKIPVRLRNKSVDPVAKILPPVGGLLILAAAVFDTVNILPKLQNAESGEFDITLLSSLDYKWVIIVSAIAAVLAAVCFVIASVRKKKAKQN